MTIYSVCGEKRAVIENRDSRALINKPFGFIAHGRDLSEAIVNALHVAKRVTTSGLVIY